MINSHPQLVLLSTFASNMTNRIMVDFIFNIISTYLLTFIVQCMKSRYPIRSFFATVAYDYHAWHCEAKLWGKRTPRSFLRPMKHITTTSAEDGQTASYLSQLSLHLHRSFSIWSMNNSHSIIKGKNSFNKLNLKATAATRGAAYLLFTLCSC